MIKPNIQPISELEMPTKKWTGIIGALLFFLFFFVIPAVAFGQEDEPVSVERPKAYIVLVDKLSVYDISPEVTPYIHRMVEIGALGLSSSRTLRGQNNIDSSLTMGAGNIARAYGGGIMAYNHDEIVADGGKSAASYYSSLTGYAPGNSAVLLINLPELAVGLSEENVTTIPGALGENLRLNGLQAAIIGNSDDQEKSLRTGAVIAMDATGQVAFGDVGQDTLMYLPDRFLNQGTNYDHMMKKLTAVQPAADLIVLELSDLARLEKSEEAFPAIYQNEKRTCLREIDTMVGRVLEGFVPERDLLLLFPVSPSADQLKLKNSFLPVIAYGKDITPGSLSSGSTRRDFIIASTDIAPTILDFFGIKDQLHSMIGVPVRVLPFAGNTLSAAADITDSTSATTRLRTLLVKSYVFLQIVFILLAVLAIFCVKSLRKPAETMILSLVTVPLVFLFLGRIHFKADIFYILGAILLVILITALFTFFFKGRMFNAFIAISSLTLLTLIIDTLTGTSLIQSSILGYDPMVGARYYGIGNEYMGIMLGSAIITSAAVYEKYSSRWILGLLAAFFIFLCFIIGNPDLGAQSDGVITAPIAFLVTIFLFTNLRMNWGLLAIVAGVVLAAMAGLISYEIQRPVELQSHLGRAFSQVAQGGLNELGSILARKASMNIKLIRYTIWSRVFLVMFLVLALLVFRPVGALKQLLQERPILIKGFAGLITGALIALIINDSGIVATSTTCIYLVIPLLLLMSEKQHKESAAELPAALENNE